MNFRDLTLVDGRFYVCNITPWHSGHVNRWIFAFDDRNDSVTQSAISAYIGGDNDIESLSRGFVYTGGRICTNSDVLCIREANDDERISFLDKIKRLGLSYNINTKVARG